MSDLKVAVIADRGLVQKFGRDALDAIDGCDEITVYSCTNSRFARKPVRHGLYYALNLLAVRNAWSRYVPVDGGAKRIARTVEFESRYEGAWQVLPREIVQDIARGGFDVVVKLGMGLLRVPDEETLPVPILSWHHGDPDRYRGRPAGFWEMAEGAPTIGQIVQIVGNKLDAGRVVAFAETKVHAHSYRSTLIEAYRHSPLIINEAIRNAHSRCFLVKPCTGRNYRLPSNLAVARFALKMALSFVRRILYGAVFEKEWKVATAAAPPAGAASLFEGTPFPPPSAWRDVPAGRGWSFYADPFHSADPPGLLVEALNRRSGLGEILLIADGAHRHISDWPGHASYPSTIPFEDKQIVVPETASFAAPAAYLLKDRRLEKLFDLDLPGCPRVSDPTLVAHEGRIYLFGNLRSVGSNALYLWSAENLDGAFRLHPSSPVRVSPLGGRMGGALLREGGRLIRFGQDFRSGYGDGLCAFEIRTLSADAYEETMIGTLRLEGARGPHTLNSRDGELLFDHYRDRFAPLAGYRRLLARLKRRLPPE